jgi:hypothetical protein
MDALMYCPQCGEKIDSEKVDAHEMCIRWAIHMGINKTRDAWIQKSIENGKRVAFTLGPTAAAFSRGAAGAGARD